MDKSTGAGLILTWGIVLYAMYHASHGAMSAYFKPNEILLVFGGAFGAAMLSLPAHVTKNAMFSLRKWITSPRHQGDALVQQLVSLAEVARRDGVLALESAAREIDDAFLRRGLSLTVDGTDPAEIEKTLRIEIDAMAERHKHGKHFFATVAKFGPGFGLMATLIAQVAMFRNLSGDPAVIGSALAIALTGTLYGTMLQNLIAGPIAEKLALRSKEEMATRELLLAGILGIQAGLNPRMVESRLHGFLAPADREASKAAA
jgi:chemotaxis protein MotA